MIREEQIDKAGLEWFPQAKKYDADVAEAFMAGARWADANPNKDNMATAYKAGEAATIDKACEWLELNVCNAYNFRGDDISIGFVEQFREAMESGCSEIPNNCEKGE